MQSALFDDKNELKVLNLIKYISYAFNELIRFECTIAKEKSKKRGGSASGVLKHCFLYQLLLKLVLESFASLKVKR